MPVTTTNPGHLSIDLFSVLYIELTWFSSCKLRTLQWRKAVESTWTLVTFGAGPKSGWSWTTLSLSREFTILREVTTNTIVKASSNNIVKVSAQSNFWGLPQINVKYVEYYNILESSRGSYSYDI